MGHGWVNHPWGLRMGWTNAEKFVFVRILRMYNWILINDHIRIGSGNFFLRYFEWFLGSGGVPWGHGWVIHPWGLRMGWADSKKLV